MEITSKFTRDDFEVWTDHFQYLDLGERHQSVPSGKSYVRGTFDPEQDAYVIDKIHIDPDMLQTDIKEELLSEAKLQASKRDKRLVEKKRVAAMPKHETKMRMERTRPPSNRPMITRDLQDTVYQIGNDLAWALKGPQGSSPGDDRWTVSGLSRSAWSINHPDIMREGESPLSLSIKKITDKKKRVTRDGKNDEIMNDWTAVGRNALTNLSNIEVLAKRKSPPGGDDWDDIGSFVQTAAKYFHKQKDDIMALKQAMLPQNPPGSGSSGQPQQGGGGEMGGMGGGMGGMMASRRARRRKAADFNMTPDQAMNALQIKGTGDVNKDKDNLRQILKKSHPDVASGPLAQVRMTAANVLMETFIRQNKPLPTTAAQAQGAGQGATVGGSATASQVNQKVQEYVSQAIRGAARLQQTFSTPNARVSPPTAAQMVDKLNEYVYGAAVTTRNLGAQGQGLYQRLMGAYNFLRAASVVLKQAGNQMNQQALQEVSKNLNGFVHTAHDVLDSTTIKQAKRRASATLDNLHKAQKIARQIHRVCGGQEWYLGVRVVNDREGIGLGVGAAEPPPRGLRSSVGGIPVVLEGPGARALRAQQEGQRRLRLARNLVAEVAGEVAKEVAHEMGIDPEAERALKHHQRLVKRVYNHIRKSKRLSGSVRYLARKLGINFNDLVRVIGQLIVEGKIELTKKKKFKPLPEPHTPVPGMKDRFSATNSVFGIDRGRSDKRVDQLLSQSVYQLNMNEPADATHKERDIRERPSNIMPDPTQPN
jgi:hypothetical protein